MEESVFVEHIKCDNCGSSDGNALYSDGHAHCFVCQTYTPPPKTGETRMPFKDETKSVDFISGEFKALPKRGITEQTCQKFGYLVGRDRSGNVVQIASYHDASGRMVAQKLRTADKQFRVVGDIKAMPLFGANLWQEGGRRLVVTEGEIDAMSVSQAFGNSWPVVSVPGGAQSAAKAIRKNLEFVESFEQVVFAFDQDEPGQEAAAECARLLSPGKASIAALPLKDANELLVAGRVKDLTSAIWQAKGWRPDGIVNGADLWDKLLEIAPKGLEYPWPGLTVMTTGQHKGTLVTWTSGSGMGKSTAVAQVAYDLAFKQGKRVGYIALEESTGRAAQRFISAHLQQPVHLRMPEPDVLKKAFDETLGTGRVWLLDHFGSADSENLLSKLRYLVIGCEVDIIILDHLSIVVSGMDLSGDERRMIDRTMTMLRTLAEETQVTIHMVSHLRRIGDDKGHEQGAQVSLAHLRGSQSIAQLSDFVIGLERDQQAEGEARDKLLVRVLKNRHSGETGVACNLTYSRETGMLTQSSQPFEEGHSSDNNPDF